MSFFSSSFFCAMPGRSSSTKHSCRHQRQSYKKAFPTKSLAKALIHALVASAHPPTLSAPSWAPAFSFTGEDV